VVIQPLFEHHALFADLVRIDTATSGAVIALTSAHTISTLCSTRRAHCSRTGNPSDMTDAEWALVVPLVPAGGSGRLRSAVAGATVDQDDAGDADCAAAASRCHPRHKAKFLGRYSHWMPVCSTNGIPHSTVRSSSPLLPGPTRTGLEFR
jgi:hypothetical protein